MHPNYGRQPCYTVTVTSATSRRSETAANLCKTLFHLCSNKTSMYQFQLVSVQVRWSPSLQRKTQKETNTLQHQTITQRIALQHKLNLGFKLIQGMQQQPTPCTPACVASSAHAGMTCSSSVQCGSHRTCSCVLTPTPALFDQ